MRRSVVSNKVAALSIAILVAVVALTISGIIAATVSATETRYLTSNADTQIVENAPTKNYGAATSLGVNENDQSSIGKDKFALVKWDLSGIAPRTQISSASVTLNVTNSSTETYQAYVLKKPWVESAATWNVYSSDKPWEVAGAKGSLDKEATAAGSITPSVKGKNTLTLPLAVVQGWVDHPATNQGIIIANPSSTRGFNFDSHEDTDPTRHPQLTLDLSPDTTPPETTIDYGPSDGATLSSRDVSFTFSTSEAGSTFECSLDSAAYTACTSPKEYTDLSEGSHTFSVKATDASGNTDASPASTTWTVDTTAPETTIDSGPSGTVSTNSADFSFSATEDGSTFECSLDGAAFEPCSSPQSYTDLSEGSHTLEVKATDQASITDPTPASRIWTVDTTTPETTIDYGPSDGATLSSRDVSFTFSASEAGSTLECSLDGAAFASCTSPKEYTDLSEGSHTFSVKATDASGNTEVSPASTTWTVDTTAPETKIDSNPNALTNSASASFGFSSTEPGSTFECKLDSGTYESCTSPTSLTGLSDGSHTFSVKATDAASNTDPTPADFTWTVDITPPDTSITDGPAEGATDTDGNVTFTFSGTDNKAIARYEVKNVKDGVEEPFLNNGLSTTKSFTNLANGSYSYRVRALDGAGNISTLAVRNYSVSIPASDTTPPDTSIISGPAEGSTDTDGNVSFSFSSTEANSTFKCKLDSGTYGSCTSPKDYTNLADGAHTFSVRATDSAGNTGPSPASRNFNVSVPVSRVSVTDFGATAGDNGNDTVAFKDAMAAAGPGEVVWVPEGVGAYRVYRVNIPSDTDMDVAAGAVIKFYGTNNGHTFAVQGPTASTFAQNIHIQGVGGSFTLDLSDAAAVSAGGFDIDNVDGFSLKHMNCINNNSNPDTTYPSSRPSCIVPSPANTTQRADGTYNDPRNLVFEDIHGYGGPYGFGLFQFTAGSNVQLTNISSEGGVAVRLENYANWAPMKNIIMNGVTCKDGHAAINFNPHGATHQGNIHIKNVTANSCESAVSIAGNGTYGPDVNVDGVTAILGNAAQVRDNDPTNAVGAWVIGPSQYCIDDRTNAYTVALSSLHCGGLPNR